MNKQLIILIISTLFLWLGKCQISLHLSHPTHQDVARRHSLTSANLNHKKLIIYHDMRVFSHSTSLSHDLAMNENYGLNQMGYFFTLNLTIGGLPYRLNIDTGSSDIFIKGQKSPGNPSIKYTCPSCKKNNEHIRLGYLDGSLQTYQANLEVQFGIHKFNESVLVAYTAQKNFQDAEGLVGLSFPSLAQNHGRTFIKTLIDNKIIDNYAFGVNLNFQTENRSFISFGSADPDLFQGTLKYYSLMSQGSYRLNVNGFSFNDGTLFKAQSALLDTGNTAISLPSKYQNQILKQFNNNGNICGFEKEENAPTFKILRCIVNNFDALPVLKIHIGDEIYAIDKDVYFQRCFKRLDGKGDECDCYIEVTNGGGLFLGDGFFNRYYTLFDLQNKKIGIAKNKEVLSYKNMFKDLSQLDADDAVFYQTLLSKN